MQPGGSGRPAGARRVGAHLCQEAIRACVTGNRLRGSDGGAGEGNAARCVRAKRSRRVHAPIGAQGHRGGVVMAAATCRSARSSSAGAFAAYGGPFAHLAQEPTPATDLRAPARVRRAARPQQAALRPGAPASRLESVGGCWPETANNCRRVPERTAPQQLSFGLAFGLLRPSQPSPSHRRAAPARRRHAARGGVLRGTRSCASCGRTGSGAERVQLQGALLPSSIRDASAARIARRRAVTAAAAAEPPARASRGCCAWARRSATNHELPTLSPATRRAGAEDIRAARG